MSGHSKWANIKHKKSRMDEKRGALFTKLGRELIVAARQGGGNPEANIRLKTAIQKAKAANMPNENIQRAIQRGTGELEGIEYEETYYEGYGPGGVAVLLQILTDNRNRTAGEIRYLFSRNGGSLGESGCVAWIFKQQGVITLDPDRLGMSGDEAMLLAIEVGAEDVRLSDGLLEVITTPEDFNQVKEALEQQGLPLATAEVTMVPQNSIEVSDPAQARQVLRLVDVLEDHDDVQEVFANFDIPEEVMEQLLESHGGV